MSLPLPNLNLNLKDVSTKYPSPSVGTCRMSVTDITCEESQKTSGLYMLKVELQLEEPYTDSDNNRLNPGYKTQTRITLPGGTCNPTEKMSVEEQQQLREKQLCQFLDACLKTDKGTRPANLTEEVLNACKGKQVLVQWKAAKDTQYGDTDIKTIKPTLD